MKLWAIQTGNNQYAGHDDGNVTLNHVKRSEAFLFPKKRDAVEEMERVCGSYVTNALDPKKCKVVAVRLELWDEDYEKRR